MGLAPERLSDYIAQWSRWCSGFLQIFQGKYKFWGRQPRVIDRIMMLDTFFSWAMSSPFRILCILAPIMFQFLGWAVFYTDLKSEPGYAALSDLILKTSVATLQTPVRDFTA
jgi:cellulose synthase (UDP-forming)